LEEDVKASYQAQCEQQIQLFGDVHQTLDAVMSELCAKLYQPSQDIDEMPAEPSGTIDFTMPPHPVEASKDNTFLVEHEGLRDKLIENMFRLDDFLLWKQRGLSDNDANERIEDRSDYGYVTWQNGGLQYIRYPDSDFDSQLDSNFGSQHGARLLISMLAPPSHTRVCLLLPGNMQVRVCIIPSRTLRIEAQASIAVSPHEATYDYAVGFKKSKPTRA
jgi:hypothetical protein